MCRPTLFMHAFYARDAYICSLSTVSILALDGNVHYHGLPYTKLVIKSFLWTKSLWNAIDKTVFKKPGTFGSEVFDISGEFQNNMHRNYSKGYNVLSLLLEEM